MIRDTGIELSREEVFFSILTRWEAFQYRWVRWISGVSFLSIVVLFAVGWVYDCMPAVWLAVVLLAMHTLAWMLTYLNGMEVTLGYQYSYVRRAFSTKRKVTSLKNEPMLNMIRSFYLNH